jgi:hypothetical protein
MPNIEQQQQTKNNYNAKYRTAATNKNQQKYQTGGFCLLLLFYIWYYSWFLFVPAVEYLVL